MARCGHVWRIQHQLTGFVGVVAFGEFLKCCEYLITNCNKLVQQDYCNYQSSLWFDQSEGCI